MFTEGVSQAVEESEVNAELDRRQHSRLMMMMKLIIKVRP